METFQNNKDCSMMIWEINPAKRNKNNEIAVIISKNTEIKVGDRIRSHGMTNGRESYYELTEIISTEQSVFPSKKYITAKSKWYQEN